MGRGFLSLVFVDDIHWLEGSTDYATRLPGQVAKINAIRPDAVVLLGDVIDTSTTSPTDQEITAAITAFKIEMDKLVCPWYYCCGNHDLYKKSVLDTALDAAGINHDSPRKVTLKGYNLALFNDNITGDTGGDGTVATADLTWYQNNFIGDISPTIACSHHTLSSATYHITNSSSFISTLLSYGNIIMHIGGHDHGITTRSQTDKMRLVTNRRSGGSWGTNNGFGVMDISPQWVNYRTMQDDLAATNDYLFFNI